MSRRHTYLLAFLMICGLLLSSLYLQFFSGFIPCALCTLQRFAFILLGIGFFLGLCFYRRSIVSFFVNIFILLSAGLGIALASRQIWIQRIPTAQNGECGAGLEYMLNTLPFTEAMQKIFTGSAECSQRGWEFLHLNMPEWALVWFVIFFCTGLYLMVQRK